MQERQVMPPTVNLFWADAVIVDIISSETIFKQNSISTINSALFFNGTVSQVRKGNPWIKMCPNFKHSDVYKTCKQQHCVSDIWVVASTSIFPTSSEMRSKLFQEK